MRRAPRHLLRPGVRRSIEQGKVLAATITGNKGPTYEGAILAAKLKIMGVDVFSAGDISDEDAGNRRGAL